MIDKRTGAKRFFPVLIAIVLFLILGVVVFPGSTGRLFASERGQRPIRAVVLNANGADRFCIIETLEALKIDKGIEPSTISAAEIVTGNLKDVDVIVFPGGSGSKQYNSLGSSLRNRIRDFVMKEGKGVVGICAGAYLVSDTPGYPCLNLVKANGIDREHDVRGSALAQVSFTADGLEIFPEMKSAPFGYIQYHDGPVFIPSTYGAQPAYRELAVFKSDIHITEGAPAGLTPGKPILLCEEVGKGRVFACAGHPESTPGMRWIVPRMVRWAARKPMVSYSPDVVRPERESREILHSDSLETEMFWQLCDTSATTQENALKTLVDLRYRNGIRWAIGLLRDTNPDVRMAAARVLAEAEYTAAIPDLEAAVAVEKDRACRGEVETSLRTLKRVIGQLVVAAAHASPTGTATDTALARVSADSLIADIDAYRDKKVEVEGLIIHVCGVDGRKMKLQTDHGAILKIVPADSLAAFDESFYRKRVRVRGIAEESRVDSAYIGRMEKDKTLLCHIDHTPCKDSTWVNRQSASGAADSLSKRDIEKLKKSMEQTGKSYIPVITIYAEEVAIIEETEK
jgi:hypothetical protein